MEFIETAVFSRQRDALFTDEEFRRLTTMLAARPEAGAVLSGAGGARKVRWADGAGRAAAHA